MIDTTRQSSLKERPKMSMAKQATFSWLILMALTIISVGLGKYWHDSEYFILLVFMIVFIKGQQVIDVYMELSTAPKLWRFLLLGYAFLIPAILILLYLL